MGEALEPLEKGVVRFAAIQSTHTLSVRDFCFGENGGVGWVFLSARWVNQAGRTSNEGLHRAWNLPKQAALRKPLHRKDANAWHPDAAPMGATDSSPRKVPVASSPKIEAAPSG
ncbi:MAG: hypothetical protein NZM37_07800 [Sandaracinaceae bacterium]|nr:hypothetical protein [Sandaracinaceae bacterium]